MKSKFKIEFNKNALLALGLLTASFALLAILQEASHVEEWFRSVSEAL